MRAAYLGEKTLNRQALPPLLFAGILLEGGIIGYDSNTKSGGLGARFLGIGGSTQYREDTVTVYLRAVSVKTGEVLSTISVRKSIESIGLDANTFRYVAFKDQNGRASCREKVCQYVYIWVVAVSLKKKKKTK